MDAFHLFYHPGCSVIKREKAAAKELGLTLGDFSSLVGWAVKINQMQLAWVWDN